MENASDTSLPEQIMSASFGRPSACSTKGSGLSADVCPGPWESPAPTYHRWQQITRK